MKKQAEKIKVPSLKLQWAVLERIYRSDNHPGTPRLCSWDRVIATFEDKDWADVFQHTFSRNVIIPSHVFEVMEISRLKAAALPSVPESSTFTEAGRQRESEIGQLVPAAETGGKITTPNSLGNSRPN